MKCPVCKEVSLTMSERSGVEIDYCPECRGVWLDRGELDKIIEKVNQAPQNSGPQQVSAQGQTSYNQGQHQNYKYKRKKSFLEEIFD